MINILFIAHHDGLSGANQSLLGLLDGLRGYPVNLFLIVPKEGDLSRALQTRDIPYRIVPVIYWMTDKKLTLPRVLQTTRKVYQSIQSIRRLARDWKIDIIYTNTSASPVGRIAALLNQKSHIWHIRELAELHFGWKFVFPRSISLALITSSASVISVCKAVNDYYFKPGAARAQVVYNGIVTKEEYDKLFRKKQGIAGHEDYIFAIIGSITQQKGQETAIRAVAELHIKGLPVKLIVAGSGKSTIENHLKELTVSLGLSNFVEFTGLITNVDDVYFASDCLLMCSDHEGLGRVILEAMSACLPVIGKNNGGTPEIIEHEKTGILYNTFEELVVAMTKMAENPEWGRQLGLAGWQSAKERFNIEDYAANIYEIIQSVSNANPDERD